MSENGGSRLQGSWHLMDLKHQKATFRSEKGKKRAGKAPSVPQ